MASEAEIDAQLEREPRNIAALVAKGELRSSAGDERAAAAFYKAALSAAQAVGQLPMSLKPAVDQALKGLAKAEQGFLEQLEQSLARSGFGLGQRPPRFQHAIDLMLGRAHEELQLQRPTSFYYPGLPQRRYFEPSEFPWAKQMEAAAAAIRAAGRRGGGEGKHEGEPGVHVRNLLCNAFRASARPRAKFFSPPVIRARCMKPRHETSTAMALLTSVF